MRFRYGKLAPGAQLDGSWMDYDSPGTAYGARTGLGVGAVVVRRTGTRTVAPRRLGVEAIEVKSAHTVEYLAVAAVL